LFHVFNIQYQKKRTGSATYGRHPNRASSAPDLLAALDTWIAGQKGKPGRPEAIRRLLAVHLARQQPKVLAPPSAGQRARLTPKRRGVETKTFVGNSGMAYVVFRTSGSYHVLAEVEPKEAARDCGAREGRNTRSQWKALWDAK
jgi:hypothetical protein